MITSIYNCEDDRGRKRLEIPAEGLVYTGKEANNIEDQPLEVTKPQVFIEEIKQKILSLTHEEARKIGIKYRSTLKRIKDRIMSEGKFNFITKEVRKLVASY